MTAIYHKESPADQAAMHALRAELRLHPPLEFGPEARPVYDELIAKTPAAGNVSCEAANVGGVPGWWCKPPDAVEGVAILYLHGGAYILGSAAAYLNFAGQIAARARAATFFADYRLAPEHRFPGALDDAIAAYRGLPGAVLPGPHDRGAHRA
jgi:epsilon-lactone hydrolase